MSVAVIIVAAGRGRRLGGEIPKQYLPLRQKSVIRRSVEVFLREDAVSWLIPVIHPDDRVLCAEALAGLQDSRVLPAVAGGDTRAISVRRGLEALQSYEPNLVLIHDAARPFVPQEVIRDVITALETSDGACAALPVIDALWNSQEGLAQAPIPREGLWRAQTPQGFVFDRILSAHRNHDGTGADDVVVAREAGLDVRLVLGSEQNYKITTQTDLERATRDAELLETPG